jgi:diguanylate cyclase (GGDEF)-like protein
VDSDTGLPGNGYFTVALHERLATARRHLWPLTLVLVDIGISPPVDPHGEAMAAASFARLVRETLREADVACRLAGTRFALVLEDTAEEGGVWTAERLQVGLSRQSGRIRRLSAGVASYPTHAMDGDEILAQAGAALDRACAAEAGRGLGPVEVAKLELN